MGPDRVTIERDIVLLKTLPEEIITCISRTITATIVDIRPIIARTGNTTCVHISKSHTSNATSPMDVIGIMAGKALLLIRLKSMLPIKIG